ncbi:MAG: lipopolysaccharide biosynthesis protein [Polyangiaceae bacterium]
MPELLRGGMQDGNLTSTTDLGRAGRSAGRGGLAVLGAKVFFLLVGFAQQPLLRLVVGLHDFGALAQALVVANTVNNVVVASATQGVSRAVAGAEGTEHFAFRSTLKVHILLAFAVAGLVAATAPLYARFERAEDVAPPLAVLAGVAFCYGVYAPLIGALNGTRRFGRQALLDVTFAILRTGGMLGVGWVFVHRRQSGVLGTTVGWLAASVLIIPIAAGALPRWGRPSTAAVPRATRSYLAVLGPIAGAQLCTNLLMQIDLALLGRFLSERTAESALTAGGARDAVKVWIAIYKECQTYAFLPYQLLFSVTLVLFPMLARATADDNRADVRAFAARGGRLAAIFCGLLVSVIVAIPGPLLTFAYGAADAARGADVLRIMVLGQGAFAMLGVATTVLTGIRSERAAALITFLAVLVVGAACYAFVPSAPTGHSQLLRSAQASASAMAVALIVAGAVVRARAGAFVPALTMVRAGIATMVCAAAGMFVPPVGRVLVPGLALGVVALYVCVLVVTRELGGADLAAVRIVARGSARRQ